MKIISIDHDKVSGTVEFSKSELRLLTYAFENLKVRIHPNNFNEILGVSKEQRNLLIEELLEFCNLIIDQRADDSTKPVELLMKIESLNVMKKTILIKIGYLESTAFFQSLVHLPESVDERDCHTLTELFFSEVLNVYNNLLEIYEQIPWEVQTINTL